jgi:hypothetical protein
MNSRGRGLSGLSPFSGLPTYQELKWIGKAFGVYWRVVRLLLSEISLVLIYYTIVDCATK